MKIDPKWPFKTPHFEAFFFWQKKMKNPIVIMVEWMVEWMVSMVERMVGWMVERMVERLQYGRMDG